MKLLIQPGDGVTALVKSIQKAKSTVEIAIFRFDHEAVEEALTSAVKRGIRVHALIAHVNGSSAEALRKLEMRLLAAGVTVARTDTVLARYHSKYLIVDGRELIVLAFNFTHQDIEKSRSFGLITRNRELVHEACRLFEADTKRQTYKADVPQFIVSPVNARKELSAFIKGAETELSIYDPRVSDTGMIQLLRERAKANVAVRIIGRMTDENGDIQVRRLKMRLHTRSIIRDRKAVFLGSQSLRELELDGRREVGIVCRDRAVVAGVLNVFEKDWVTAEPVNEKDRPHPATKVAKKVAKAVTNELPEVAPLLNGALKEITEQAADVKIAPEVVEETVRDAVKEAVKTALQEVIHEQISDASTKTA